MRQTPIEVEYATHNGISLWLDILLPPDACRARPASICVWLHYGGLVQGSRKTVPEHLIKAARALNIAVVAPDHRLAPQAKLSDVLKDCVAMLKYIQSDSFADTTESKCDASKICLAGASAGGWLAMMLGFGIGISACGLRIPQAPVAIAVFYPITDLPARSEQICSF